MYAKIKSKGQILLERPDWTRPDEYFRVSDQVFRDFVSDKV